MFRVGEIVICNNLKVSDFYYRGYCGSNVRRATPIKNLTLNQSYTIIGVQGKLIKVINDAGQPKIYSSKRFKLKTQPRYMLSAKERKKRFVYD